MRHFLKAAVRRHFLKATVRRHFLKAAVRRLFLEATILAHLLKAAILAHFLKAAILAYLLEAAVFAHLLKAAVLFLSFNTFVQQLHALLFRVDCPRVQSDPPDALVGEVEPLGNVLLQVRQVDRESRQVRGDVLRLLAILVQGGHVALTQIVGEGDIAVPLHRVVAPERIVARHVLQLVKRVVVLGIAMHLRDLEQVRYHLLALSLDAIPFHADVILVAPRCQVSFPKTLNKGAIVRWRMWNSVVNIIQFLKLWTAEILVQVQARATK